MPAVTQHNYECLRLHPYPYISVGGTAVNKMLDKAIHISFQ